MLKAFDRCHKDSGDKTRFWKLCLRKDWAGWNVSDISGVCYTSVGHHSAPFTFLEVSRDILCFVLKSKICENSGWCEPGQCVGISWLTKQQGNSHGHSQALVPSGGHWGLCVTPSDCQYSLHSIRDQLISNFLDNKSPANLMYRRHKQVQLHWHVLKGGQK